MEAKVSTNGVGIKKTTTVELNFHGFYQENAIDGIKAVDGIYVAYACTLNTDSNGKVVSCDPKRVIYIGMGTGTDNVHVRVGKHINEDHEKWKMHLSENEHIVYSYADCPANIVHDVEAAMIYRNKPKENDVSKDIYTGETHLLTVISSGRIGPLMANITVL